MFIVYVTALPNTGFLLKFDSQPVRTITKPLLTLSILQSIALLPKYVQNSRQVFRVHHNILLNPFENVGILQV